MAKEKFSYKCSKEVRSQVAGVTAVWHYGSGVMSKRFCHKACHLLTVNRCGIDGW